MANERHAMFWLAILVAMAGEQLGKHLIGTRLAFVLRLERAVPPACLVEVVGKGDCAEIFHEEGAWSPPKSNDIVFISPTVDAALFMDLLLGNQG